MRSVGMRRDAPRNGTSGIPSAYGSLNSVCAVWACGVMLLKMDIAGSLVLRIPWKCMRSVGMRRDAARNGNSWVPSA